MRQKGQANGKHLPDKFSRRLSNNGPVWPFCFTPYDDKRSNLEVIQSVKHLGLFFHQSFLLEGPLRKLILFDNLAWHVGRCVYTFPIFASRFSHILKPCTKHAAAGVGRPTLSSNLLG